LSEPSQRVRVDKWLWQARFFKTRALAAKAAAKGLRINGRRTDKVSAAVGPGDVITFSDPRGARVVAVRRVGERRGPAAEAATLYDDLTPAATGPLDNL